MTEQEMGCVEACVNNAVAQAVDHSLNDIVRRHDEISRQVMIDLSPLEKFVGKQVKVSTFDRMWTGTLVTFHCGSWVEIDQDGHAVVIFTGTGTSIEPFIQG